MTICKFYQNGNCRNGNNCRFEHVNAGGGNNYRNPGPNRFGALGGGNNNQNHGDKYNITTDAIERDLTSETPQWILSAYAPGRDAPEQLFGGYPREQSFEEMRLHFMTGKASGNEQQALNEAQQLYTNAQQQMQNAARNAKDAVQFLVSAENKHPNRLDICQQGTQGAPFGEFLVGKRPKSLVPDPSAQSNPFGSNNTSSPFGGGASTMQNTTQGSAFGQPSTLGQRPNPFGTPSFAQSSQPAPSSAFGQPSTLGAKPSPFGTPSFGTPAQPNTSGSAFGQPSQLGQKPNPFAASANTGNNLSPFASSGNNNSVSNNNPSPFASTSNNNNAQAPSPFGTTPGTQGASPFAPNNNQNNNNAPNPFGQPSQAPAQNVSPFAQTSTPAAPNPFATSNQAPSAPNGNPFAQAQQPSNGFLSQQNQQSQQQPSPFNSAPTMSNASQQGQVQKPAAQAGSPYPPGSSRQHPPVESYSSKGMDGRLSMFKGKPVVYKDDKPGIRAFDGTWRRIWFPDGAPNYSKDTELPPGQYDEKSKAQWAAFQQTGTFQDGLMPALPPPRECTVWDF